MTELTEFLLARIAEDEDLAADAEAHHEGRPDRWELQGRADGTGVMNPIVTRTGRPDLQVASGFSHRGAARHAAHWDPARVHAECEAKRQVVELADFADEPGAWPVYLCVLRNLASVYADHPDYREEWRPHTP